VYLSAWRILNACLNIKASDSRNWKVFRHCVIRIAQRKNALADATALCEKVAEGVGEYP
jgi:hypothetical protein